MDRRHYTSLLILAGVVVIAWVLAKFQPPASPSTAEQKTSVVTLPVHTEAHASPASNLDASTNSKPTGSSPQPTDLLKPQIPGLLDDSREGFELAVGSSTIHAKSLPLRAVSDPGASSNTTEREPRRAESPDESLADGSTPRIRRLPSFSMPNTQRTPADQSPSYGSSDVNFDRIDSTEKLRPLETSSSRVEPSPAEARAIPTPAPFPAGFPQDQAALEQPSLLPNQRHVLRPITRVSPTSNNPTPAANITNGRALADDRALANDRGSATLALPATGPIAPPAQTPAAGSSAWDAPMPGVRSRAGQARDPGVPVNSPTQPVAQPTSNPNQPPVGPVGDVLFQQAVQDLYGIPNEPASAANDHPPRTPFANTGHALSVPPPVQTPLKPRPMPTRTGRPTSDYIWHVIQPHESLETISSQYLGDPREAARLIEINADLVPDPRLLPVGKAIRIPLR